MNLFRKKSDLIVKLNNLRKNNFKIGLVPTMGALHKGHTSLVKRSIKENDYTIVLVEQVTEPPNPERKVTQILSPGTSIFHNKQYSQPDVALI